MFFSWFKENKHFQKEGGLSGQIVPFLLVVLVILLIAAIATINIGRVSLDKTCSSNAADAGALSAASGYAAALNSLAQMNLWQLKEFYDLNRDVDEQLYEVGDKYLNDALQYALLAAVAAGAGGAATALAGDPPLTCQSYVWVGAIVAAALDATAAYYCYEASVSIRAYGICAGFMKSITESFHDSQNKSFCQDVSFMDNAYESSYQAGIMYAFSNSCISSKLSNEQNDAFSAWLAAPLADNGPIKTKTFSWEDKLSTLQKPRIHTVSLSLSLPKISAYELAHTIGTYSEIDELLEDCVNRANAIAQALDAAQSALLALASALSILAVIEAVAAYAATVCYQCWAEFGTTCAACGIWETLCNTVVLPGYESAMSNTAMVVGIIAGIVAAYGGTSIYELISKNEEAYDDWQPAKDIASINGTCWKCGTCINRYPDDACATCDASKPTTCQSCVEAEPLMVIQITDLNPSPSGWVTSCSAAQEHPGTSGSEQNSSSLLGTKYDKITSYSNVEFTGGDIGNFNGTDPNAVDKEGNPDPYANYKPYDPRLTWTK